MAHAGPHSRENNVHILPRHAAAAVLLAPVLAAALVACAPPPRVPDGDKLLIGSTHYQLWGIEAPGLHQTCDDDWPAGQEARRALEALTRDRTIVCEPRGLDRYRRVLALCRAGGQDIAASMVGAGLAWADVTQTRTYAGIEREAYVKGLGIHGRNCLPSIEKDAAAGTGGGAHVALSE